MEVLREMFVMFGNHCLFDIAEGQCPCFKRKGSLQSSVMSGAWLHGSRQDAGRIWHVSISPVWSRKPTRSCKCATAKCRTLSPLYHCCTSMAFALGYSIVKSSNFYRIGSDRSRSSWHLRPQESEMRERLKAAWWIESSLVFSVFFSPPNSLQMSTVLIES